uniref:Uncharacterized protein n=1 Tax=Arundo donax TaxID=35708 RepID=A0A0A9GEB9_ARUDO
MAWWWWWQQPPLGREHRGRACVILVFGREWKLAGSQGPAPGPCIGAASLHGRAAFSSPRGSHPPLPHMPDAATSYHV